jgi:restriction system protein
LSPTEYEQVVANLVRNVGREVTDWQVMHLDSIDGVDGTYIIDVTVRFRLLGADFLVLFECKQHASPVKREDVQVLRDKLRSTGAHKGVVIAATGFQRGALVYARTHGIACVRLADGAWTYELRHMASALPQPFGSYVSYELYLTERGYGNTMLSGQRDYARAALLE